MIQARTITGARAGKNLHKVMFFIATIKMHLSLIRMLRDFSESDQKLMLYCYYYREPIRGGKYYNWRVSFGYKPIIENYPQ